MKCPTPLPSSPNFPSNSCASCIMWPDIIKIRLYKNKCWHQTEITHYFRTTEYGIHARYLPNNTNSLGFPAWYLHQRTRRGDSQIFPSNISDLSVPSDDAERCIRVNCNQSHIGQGPSLTLWDLEHTGWMKNVRDALLLSHLVLTSHQTFSYHESCDTTLSKTSWMEVNVDVSLKKPWYFRINQWGTVE